MLDLEHQKRNFAEHVASFQDYGNIKVLDFQRPGHCEYRIRFLFEEDHYRLHISGDLGELIAFNYNNMVWERFYEHYAHNSGYFEEKIQTHSRPIYIYEADDARTELKEVLKEWFWEPDGIIYDTVDEFIDDILEDFDELRGMGSEGYNRLSEVISDAWEIAPNLGKQSSGIIELYLLAFELAYKQLTNGDQKGGENVQE